MAADLARRGLLVRDVVLVGAGHAHVDVLRSFARERPANVQLTLITRMDKTPYSGMLPGLIAGHYQPDDMQIDIGPLARLSGTRVVLTEAVGLDASVGQVLCRNGLRIRYDVVSFDIGSTPNTQGVPGAGAHAIPVKPIDGFLARFDDACGRISERRNGSRIVVVGGGAAGVELMLAIHHRFQTMFSRDRFETLNFSIITGSAKILPAFPRRFRARLRAILAGRGIGIVEGARVTSVSSNGIGVEGSPAIPADEVFWTTEATAPGWLRETGLALDGRGFIEVEATLRARDQQAVFAAGDVAAFMPRALPKSGVFAVRQGPVLDRNLRRLLAGESLIDFRPQSEALYLLATGARHAVGTRNGLVFEGNWVWRFKNWLDTRFMSKYKLAAGPSASACVNAPSDAG
ncbi:FAD-dependent oxidoreductase [Bradyrhizobium sp. BTAi1]|uniref:FAD-dependent oxidoreductase n=1 Tax=Bradyrhizobium sp. (strain BTAi1 / ATCC BAA-1182) TaxID=288000 RepID=UPI00005DEC40|nr:FAD-dependent oxidoreductase [Bradyrhizobium sp. BTAi1]ABQ35485.1 putative Selenide, water dikinase [Bradyrhizobium sp. BTAi1]